jgi:DNA-binding response OmpR family regulator
VNGKLLVIEDNPRVASLLAAELCADGYDVTTAASATEGEALGATGGFSAIVLDVMLPDGDGIHVCRNLRRRGLATPILMLTALSSTEERVAGLNAGADDYLPKPFETAELLARLRALLRRARAAPETEISVAGLTLDLVKRTAQRGGRTIGLTTKEFALLEHFMRNQNRVLTREQIGERVWDMNFEEESNVIEVYVSRLRNKVDRPFDQALSHTVPGAGYILSDNGPPAA